jgi:hypothetical protein
VVGGVDLELQNRGQKHREPLAKLGAEGIKEWVARTPTTMSGGGKEAELSRGGAGGRREMERGSAPAHCHTEIRPQPTWGGGDRRQPALAPPPRVERSHR